MSDSAPSTFSLWLEEALTGWILPAAALAAAGGAYLLYTLGLLPEGPAAAALAVLVAALVGLLMVKPSLAPSAEPIGRWLAVAAAVGVALVALGGALPAVLPGEPVAQGELATAGESLPLPAGLAGRVRVLAHAPLPPGGTPQVDFRLGGTVAPAEGRVERTVSYARVGRGSRTAVAHDHNETWVRGTLSAGAAALTLDRLSGPLAGPLHLAVHGDPLPAGLLWAVGVAALLAAAVAHSRLRKGNVAALAGMGVAYGLLVGANATPVTAVGTSLGGILLGGIGGALAGGFLELLAKLGPWAISAAEAEQAARRKRGA
jgi:hypothetical protein